MVNRNKICELCSSAYYDKTKRAAGKTCSLHCARLLGVKKRKENGSYEMSDLQKEKISKSLKKAYLSGRPKEGIANKEAQQKIRKTPGYNEKVLKERKKTNLDKYGYAFAQQSPEIRAKIEKTNLTKYGSKSPMKSPEVTQKMIQTKKDRGSINLHKEKTAYEWAEELGVSYSWFNEVARTKGFDLAESLCPSKTDIELVVEKILQKNNLRFKSQQFLTSVGQVIVPDFILPDFRLIIECDGLYWHSDAIDRTKNKLFHKERKEKFLKLGYKSLFFRSDEIEDSPLVIESIIKNKTFNSKKIHGRSCQKKKIEKLSSKNFLDENHLMKNGRGESFGLMFDGELACLMQIKWRNKKERILEISRFCNKINVSVIGGWSKLISFVAEEMKPSKIVTFVDKRYGEGSYLKGLGWQSKNEDVSFKWTNGTKSFHRMKYKGRSGYDEGFYKIWDCGQERWEIDVA